MSDRVEPAGERVRLVDVALACGVTKSVASRALNGDPSLNIRPATRMRILAAAQELGYRPHAGARALAGARARALALLIPDLSNPGPAAARVRQPGDPGFRAQRRDGPRRGQRHGRAPPARARAHPHRPGV